jgi:catechol 2,3-dioxygenase-like lactoylglutathione lyase family enzyme
MTAVEPRILEVNNVGLRVQDIERSLVFYREVMGLAVQFTSPWLDNEDLLAVGGTAGATMRMAVLLLPGLGGTLNLIEFAGLERSQIHARPHDPGTIHLSLGVDQLESWVDRMRDHGHEPVAEPRRISVGPGAARIAFFADPDGFYIELVEKESDA